MSTQKHIFSFFYLIVPVCFFIANIIVGLIQKHSFSEIYNNGLGMIAFYYFLISLIFFLRWNYFIKNLEK